MQNIKYLASRQAKLSDYCADGAKNPCATCSIGFVYTIRILLTLGAQIFMWTVRHMKT